MLEENIRLIRGDTGLFVIHARNGIGDDIDLGPDIKIYFTVKKQYWMKGFEFQKTIGQGITYSKSDNKYHLIIDPADTSHLDFGEYYYDIEIIMNNKTFTLCKGKFFIDWEVTYLENEV